MLDETIKSLRTTNLTIAALSLFVFITLINYEQEVRKLHNIEKVTFICKLFLESGGSIAIPAYSDEAIKYVSEFGIKDIDLISTITHMNYALPIWFGNIYCGDSDDSGVALDSGSLLTWNQWDVYISKKECDYKTAKKIYLENFERNNYDDDNIIEINFDNLPKEVSNEKYRLPADYIDLTLDSHDTIALNTQIFIEKCFGQFLSGKNDDSSENLCDIEMEEVSISPDLFKEQIGWEKEESDSKSKGQYNGKQKLASLKIYFVHEKTQKIYLASVSNQAFTELDIEGEALGFADNKMKIQVESIDQELTRASSLDLLGKLYTEATGVSYHKKDSQDLIAWVENESRKLYQGNIFVPIVGLSIPINWLLSSVAAVYIGIMLWAYFLVRNISKDEKLQPSVPWMLSIWRWMGSDGSRRQKTRNIAHYILGCSFLAARAAVYFLPGILLLSTVVITDNIAYAYLLPNLMSKISISVVGIFIFSLAVLMLLLDISTIQKIRYQHRDKLLG